VSGPNKFAV